MKDSRDCTNVNVNVCVNAKCIAESIRCGVVIDCEERSDERVGLRGWEVIKTGQ
jgi:hypothetical protein